MIGPYTIFNSDTTNQDTPDIFLIKFAPNGTVAWATSEGEPDIYDVGNAVVADSMGNAYVTGYFADSSITFGNIITNTVTENSANIFVVKYAPSGNVLWAKAVGDSANEEGTSIDISPTGDCYITGYFGSPTLAFGAFTLLNSGSMQMYIAKTGEEAGINFYPDENAVSVFPNPASTEATFQMSGLNGNKTLIIYNQLGKEIWRKETLENQIEFLTEGIAAGLYFYRMEQKGETKAAGKLIVQ
jgi:hypothetical protein